MEYGSEYIMTRKTTVHRVSLIDFSFNRFFFPSSSGGFDIQYSLSDCTSAISINHIRTVRELIEVVVEACLTDPQLFGCMPIIH